MANDRMFIINKVTGNRFYIAKRYSDDWDTSWQGPMAEAWKEYLDQSCGYGPYEPHAWTIGYEDTEEEFEHLPLIIFSPTQKEEREKEKA